MRGYKAFDADLKCRGMQYEIGETATHDGPLEMCESGLHFCDTVAQVFDYYPVGSRVCEVESEGEVIGDGSGKHCTARLKVVRELDASEISSLVNMGHGNAGSSNSGNCNSGDRNSGNCNSGDWNSGHWNSGDCNSGHCNSGSCNSGSGNSGHWNSGDCNSGNCNSGDRNSGNCNSGDWNATDYSSGVLCTEEPECLVFDRPSCMTLRQWRASEAAAIMSRIEVPAPYWREWSELSDAERETCRRMECQGGVLVVPENVGRPDFAGWWAKLDDRERGVIMAIPNFDAAKWKAITGIEVPA